MKLTFLLLFLLLFLFNPEEESGIPLTQQIHAARSTPDKSFDPSGRTRLAEDPFLDTLQKRTFRWFLDLTPRATGLTPDRWPTVTFSSIAAVGFGLTAYPIGVERGYVTREEARERVLNTLRFFWSAPQGPDATKVAGHKGFYYHFLDFEKGHRYQTVELSSMDTVLLLAGVLMCQSYFDQNHSAEGEIRALADSIYRRVDWRFYHVRPPLLSMGWHPEKGFNKHDWTGYMESMILYILALGSPTHPIEAAAWEKWASTYKWAEYYGYEFINFPPLFGHQYSHLWIDFRGIQDRFMREKGIDYFENSRRATYSQQAYGRKNPNRWKDYSDQIWGWTACDGPADTSLVIDRQQRRFWRYRARGVAFDRVDDDGTIAPTAAGGSIIFAPEICIPALKAMKERYGSELFRKYGFADAFNPSFITTKTPNGWFDVDYIGIDQGPILIAIENFRSELVWNTMKKNPYIVQGLKRAGFTGGWLDAMENE